MGISADPLMHNSPVAWKTFLQAHWDSIAAVDFTTVEVWTKSGLITFYILVVMRLNRMIFFGRRSLERALKEFSTHYHHERNHQGLGNRLIQPGDQVGQNNGEVRCRERLGGMLRYCHQSC